MGNAKENLKGLFANTRTRIIIIFTASVLIFGIVLGLVKMRSTFLPES